MTEPNVKTCIDCFYNEVTRYGVWCWICKCYFEPHTPICVNYKNMRY